MPKKSYRESVWVGRAWKFPRTNRRLPARLRLENEGNSSNRLSVDEICERDREQTWKNYRMSCPARIKLSSPISGSTLLSRVLIL